MKNSDNQPCIEKDLSHDDVTGFKPLTDAIAAAHEEPKARHFINEFNLLNRILTGMDQKKFKSEKGVESVRDALSADDLGRLRKLQINDAYLIKIGVDYKKRKEMLIIFNKSILENVA